MTLLRLRYQTLEFAKTDIHLCTLRDKQQFSDPDGVAEEMGICSAAWPIFGTIWPSSLALAHHLDDFNIAEKRILEVGCGIALPSLLLNSKNADITATDYHPEAERFLIRNTKLNNGKVIAFQRMDWGDKKNKLGKFNLIIGSDLLYEDRHVELLANFIDTHSEPRCEVVLVDPGRGRKTKLSARMIELGNTNTCQVLTDDNVEGDFKGHILKFKR